MFSDDIIAEHFRPDVRKIVLTLDAADSQPVRPDFILQPRRCASSCRFHVDKKMCCVAFVSMINTGFAAKPESHIMLSTSFASDGPNAAAHNSASALLLAMICCLLVYAFKKCRLHERDSRA